MPLSAREEVDIVIIGSGPTGAAYARTLSDEWPGVRILMVEAGPVIARPLGLHIANIRDHALREAAQLASQGPKRNIAYAPMSEAERLTRRYGGPDTSMLRRPGLFVVGSGPVDGDEFPAAHAAHNVGGMGAHWFCASPRPSESERIPFIPRPIMDEALSAAERLLGVSQTQFGASHVAAPLRAVLSGLFDAGRAPDRRVQPMPMAVSMNADGVYRSGPNVILGDLAAGSSASFTLRADTICHRILMKGARAEGVEIRHAETGIASEVGAKIVVVAADSLHSPQLLFASGIRPPALGRHLNEHPQLSVLAVFDGVRAGEEIDLLRGGGVLGDRTIVSRMTSGVMWIPYGDEEFPFHVQISQVEPASLFEDERADAAGDAVLSVSLFLPSDLQSDNQVSFSETETDWLGRPKMRLRFKWSERDTRRMGAAHAMIQRICTAIGRPLLDNKPRTPPHGSSLHYQGTMRMGPEDDGLSVCDRNSRLWGIDNVYVAGNGVIPTMTAGNPTLTSVALSVLAARSIARKRSA